MGLFVVNTVAPGGEEHKIPDSLLHESYQIFEKFLRVAYAKPVETFELHLHHENKCTNNDEVPPWSFDVFMKLNMMFKDRETMNYYVCFIPRANNQPPQLPGTPVREQEHFSPLSAVQSVEQDVGRVQATTATNHEHHLEDVVGPEASSHPRRAVAEGANVRPAQNPDRSTTKRPLASEDSIHEQRKQARTIEPGLLPGPARETLVSNIANPALPHPAASSLEHIRKELPERSIIPIKDGLPGSAAHPIILEREHTDPEIDEKAYKFFASHQLPHPHRHRFKIGVINKRTVPSSWELDEGGRLNAVFVQLEVRPRVSHFVMDEDENGHHLKRPTINRVSLDMVNYDSGIQILYNMNRLKNFLLRYNQSLIHGLSFEQAQAVLADLGSCGRPRNNDEAVVDHEDDATRPTMSKIVILHISSGRFNSLISKLYGCTNCQKADKVCEPLESNGYSGCKLCKESSKLCNLAVIEGENRQSRVRAARPKAHTMEQSDTDSSHASESSQVAAGETASQAADSADYPSFTEENEYRELYGLTPPRSHPPPNLINTEIPEQPIMPAPIQTSGMTEQQEQQQSSSRPSQQTSTGPRIVRLRIHFWDCIKINDDSQPLDFEIASIQALRDWTVAELVEKLLRERITNQIMNMGGEELTSVHRKDLSDADLCVHRVTRAGLDRLLFKSSDVEKSDSSWLEDAVTGERTISLVVYMRKVDLAKTEGP